MAKENKRAREKDRNRLASRNFDLCACAKNQRAVLLHPISRMQNSFFGHLTLISRKPVQRRGNCGKCVFFPLLAGRHQRFKRMLYMEDASSSKVQGYFHIVFNMPIVIRVHQPLPLLCLCSVML